MVRLFLRSATSFWVWASFVLAWANEPSASFFSFLNRSASFTARSDLALAWSNAFCDSATCLRKSPACLSKPTRCSCKGFNLASSPDFFWLACLSGSGMPSNCLIIFSTSASWPFKGFVCFSFCSIFCKTGARAASFCLVAFSSWAVSAKAAFSFFSGSASAVVLFFSSSVLVFVRVSSSGIFFSKTTKLSSCLSTAFFAPSLSASALSMAFFFSAIGLASASLRDFSTAF